MPRLPFLARTISGIFYGSDDHSDSDDIMELKSIPSGDGYTESPDLYVNSTCHKSMTELAVTHEASHSCPSLRSEQHTFVSSH